METKEHIPEPMGQGSNQKVNLKKKKEKKNSKQMGSFNINAPKPVGSCKNCLGESL